MRNFDLTFNDFYGLRGFQANPRQRLKGFVECFNVKPDKTSRDTVGLVPFEQLTRLWPLEYHSWPYIQYFGNNRYRLHCLAQNVRLYRASATTLLDVAYTYPPGAWWDFVDFSNRYFFMSNGQNNVVLDVDTDTLAWSGGSPITPRAYTCTSFNGQLILGKINQPWPASNPGCGPNSIVWSKMNNIDCTPSHDNIAGFMNLEGLGEVRRVKRLGNFVMVYGDTHSMALTPHEQTWAVAKRWPIGIPAMRAVDGDNSQHVLVDRRSEVWRIDERIQPMRLGYREWIEPFTQENIVISYDTEKREFYITALTCGDVNGICGEPFPRCYLLNDYGLCEVHQVPSHMLNIEGIAYAPFIDNGDREVRIETDTFDMGERSMKLLANVTVGGNCESGDIEYRVGWKQSVTTARDDFTYRPWSQVPSTGMVQPQIAGTDFRLGIRMNTYRQDLGLDYLLLRYNFEDVTIQRGNYRISQWR